MSFTEKQIAHVIVEDVGQKSKTQGIYAERVAYPKNGEIVAKREEK
jgi:hypothetical protein